MIWCLPQVLASFLWRGESMECERNRCARTVYFAIYIENMVKYREIGGSATLSNGGRVALRLREHRIR